MTPNQFLQLLVTQLTTQDPLSPVDDNSFMQQMVGLAELQSTSSLTGSLTSFQNFMELSSGSALIGKSVTGQDASGNPVEGTVSSVLLENGTVNVVIGSQTIPLTSVTQING
jgi:flagellar basal-body rod modification protein FlgD